MTSPAFEAVRRAAATPTLLVALDFDGTLAPTVDDPAAARALPAAVVAIEQLSASPNTVVAIVSGRPLGGLREVLSVPAEVLLVGSHGAESSIDGEETWPELTAVEHDLLEAACAAVEAVAARFEGARMERKPSGLGLHTRLASRADAEDARRDALAAIRALEGSGRITERDGKDILEFMVRSADKGAAVNWLREYSGATALVFIGDDVTDEDGFRALTTGDVGVKVGEGESAAEFRVADPVEATNLVVALSRARNEPRDSSPTSRTP